MVAIPDRSALAGVPSQSAEDITSVDVALFTGSAPAPLTQDLLVAASQTLAAYSLVGFDVNGRLVPALLGTTPAIGILVAAITTSASTTYAGAPVYRGGCFNPDKLVWPASYDTDAKKFAAFNGAPTPTNIIIRRPKTASV